MSSQKLGNVVFRVQFNDSPVESQLVAYDLISKAWFQNSTQPWGTQRKLLLEFGISELYLSQADETFQSGLKDAQFAAIPIPLDVLDENGFQPKVW